MILAIIQPNVLNYSRENERSIAPGNKLLKVDLAFLGDRDLPKNPNFEKNEPPKRKRGWVVETRCFPTRNLIIDLTYLGDCSESP